MATVPVTLSSIQVDLLRTAQLKNEEIIELTAFICQAEAIEPFRQHLQILRDKYDMTLEIRPLEIEVISLRDRFKVRNLRNLYAGLGDQGYHSLILPLITGYQQDKNAALYAQTLEEVFAIDLDEQFIRQILEYLKNSEMDGPGVVAIQRYLRNKLDRVSEYAPIPNYVRDYDILVSDLPRLEKKPIDPDLPNELIADYLLTRIDNYLVIEEEEPGQAKQALIDRLERMNEIEKKAFVDLFQVDEEEIARIRADRDIFRVYGPVNPYPDTDFSILTTDEGQPDVNVIFGGARMFTDNSLEYDYENDLPVDDWFRGYCLQCSRRIRNYHHAVREPLLTGGWRGCYCSFDCVLKFIELDTESDPDLYNLYTLRVNLLRVVDQDIAEIGIADRDYDEPEEEDETGEGIDRLIIDQDAVNNLALVVPRVEIPEPYVPQAPEDIGELNES